MDRDDFEVETVETCHPPLGIKVSEEDMEWEEADEIDFGSAEQGGWEDGDFDDDDWEGDIYDEYARDMSK